MPTSAWVVLFVTFALSLVPGLRARGTRRFVLLASSVASFALLVFGETVFQQRDQLYAGGALVMMGVLPPLLFQWVLGAWGAGSAVRALMGSRRGAAALSWGVGLLAAVIIFTALSLATG